MVAAGTLSAFSGAAAAGGSAGSTAALAAALAAATSALSGSLTASGLSVLPTSSALMNSRARRGLKRKQFNLVSEVSAHRGKGHGNGSEKRSAERCSLRDE